MTELETYIAKMSDSQRAEYERVLAMVLKHAPEATAQLSYGIAGFKLHKKALLYFGAFTSHTSIFPASDELIAAVPNVAQYRTSKGTLRFSQKAALKDEDLEAIVLFSVKAIKK